MVARMTMISVFFKRWRLMGSEGANISGDLSLSRWQNLGKRNACG
jgi:hypothetical protein